MLERLDVRMVYPGHGRAFSDAKSAIMRTRKRLQGFLGDRKRIGDDLLKKIIVYTLMMRRSASEATFFNDLMATPWFTETVNHYFDKEYQRKFDNIMAGLFHRGIVRSKDGSLFATINP